MKFVDKIQKSRAGNDDLKYHLHKQLAGYEKARTVKRVHASELFHDTREFCPREMALLDILGRRRPDELISAASRLTFSLGNMYANKIIHTLADAGLAMGDWECYHCGKVFTNQERPYKCRTCDGKRFKYVEKRFKSRKSWVSCGVDCLRKTTGTKLRAIELKSIKKEEFKTLAGPLKEHKIRTNLYLRIIKNCDDEFRQFIDTDTAEILYICKAGYIRDDEVTKWDFKDDNYSPFKVFTVNRDNSKTEEKWQHAIRLKEFRQGKKGTPLGICGTQWCPRAEVCPVRDECFSGKYKGES